MKESEKSLKDSLIKNERRGENYIEVKNDLSRSIILEDQASKYRISKRHSANKEKISFHHKKQTIYKFDVKNINFIKFEEIFLDETKYARESKEKNLFEGPSSFTDFYKERRIKIREKNIQIASGDLDYNI